MYVTLFEPCLWPMYEESREQDKAIHRTINICFTIQRAFVVVSSTISVVGEGVREIQE